MPALDAIHHHVRRALNNEGWTITAEDIRQGIGRRYIYMDILADRNTNGIAVEVKTALGNSPTRILRDAVGHYDLYECILNDMQSPRIPFLAVDTVAAKSIFDSSLARAIIRYRRINLIVINIRTERIVEWRVQ